MTNLITLAGDGSRFKSDGSFIFPKPLIQVDGEPMIIKAVDCLPLADKYVFVCKTEHVERYKLDEILKARYNNVEIVTIDETTRGQACTAEIGISKSSITNDDDILISSCDYGLEYDANTFQATKEVSDIVVWSTKHNKAFANNPSAYSWIEENNLELQRVYVKEDKYDDPYNKQAIVGTFYFKKASYFLDALDIMYRYKIETNGEYYIDNMFNITNNRIVKLFPVTKYKCWGTPKDLKNYEN